MKHATVNLTLLPTLILCVYPVMAAMKPLSSEELMAQAKSVFTATVLSVKSEIEPRHTRPVEFTKYVFCMRINTIEKQSSSALKPGEVICASTFKTRVTDPSSGWSGLQGIAPPPIKSTARFFLDNVGTGDTWNVIQPDGIQPMPENKQ
ncbi:hypothetical protein [Silvimonas amylolytica]|uniref:hypothetical protein n=1 Tax=Silvimonas amylolytica TaxID=449663 RepID=UPI00166B097A|nr:hypothetical protein [Silvimonas amylolytica]